MKRDEYLKMLFEDNETEKDPTKELHEAVLECAVEALSLPTLKPIRRSGFPSCTSSLRTRGAKRASFRPSGRRN